jgi:hypothetical protein
MQRPVAPPTDTGLGPPSAKRANHPSNPGWRPPSAEDRSNVDVHRAWRRRGRRRLATLCTVFGAIATVLLGTLVAWERPGDEPLSSALVFDGPSAASWRSTLQQHGVLTSIWNGRASRRSLVVVPGGTTLGKDEISTLHRIAAGGGSIVTSDAELIRSFGVQLGDPRDVGGVVFREYEQDAVPKLVRSRTLEAGAEVDSVAWAWAADQEAVLAAQYAVGEGQLVALGWDPAADGAAIWKTFPNLGRLLTERAASVTTLSVDGLELFYDPREARLGHGDLGIDHTADLLSVARTTYVAGFVADETPGRRRALVEALQARGTRALAWLSLSEFPVGAAGIGSRCGSADSVSGVDLARTGCADAIWSEAWEPVIRSAPWDGVIVSGVAGGMAAEPIAALVEKAQTAGFADITVGAAPGGIATAMQVATARGARLQVDRHDQAALVASGFAGRQVIRVSAREPGPIVPPTRLASGEFMAAVADAAIAGVVALDGFGAVSIAELRLARGALAARTGLENGQLSAPWPVRLHGARAQIVAVDGFDAPPVAGGASVSAGQRRVGLRRGEPAPSLILRVGATITSARFDGNRIVMSVVADHSYFLVLRSQRAHVEADGTAVAVPLVDKGDVVPIRLPAGSYELVVRAD